MEGVLAGRCRRACAQAGGSAGGSRWAEACRLHPSQALEAAGCRLSPAGTGFPALTLLRFQCSQDLAVPREVDGSLLPQRGLAPRSRRAIVTPGACLGRAAARCLTAVLAPAGAEKGKSTRVHLRRASWGVTLSCATLFFTCYYTHLK